MAWNPSPKVAAARDFGEKFKAKQVIVLFVTEDKMGVVSYGRTRALCNDAKRLGDRVYDALSEAILDANEEDEIEWA